MKTIDETQDELVADFEVMDDWMDKYDYIIQLGKALPLIDERYKTDDHTIKGCQSKVWMASELQNERVQFTADSDAIITKGLISMVIKILTNHTPQEISNAKLYFVDKIGLTAHLSSARSNGLAAMIKQMKLDTLALAQ